MLNLTQHNVTPAQVRAGVIEPKDKDTVKRLLTFDSIPSQDEMNQRARDLVSLALLEGAESAMIGGAPYFMSTLELAFADSGVKFAYAFSVRKSVDTTLPDGSVKKDTMFEHTGWAAPSCVQKLKDEASYYKYEAGH